MDNITTTEATQSLKQGLQGLDQFTVLKERLEEIRNLMLGNLGPGGLDEYKLPRINVPTGGSISFSLTDNWGNPQPASKFRCIIVRSHAARSYWKEAYGSGGSGRPPDCWSADTITGYGNPGGECAKCPLAAFGSGRPIDGKASRGQACRQTRQLWVVRKDMGIIPENLIVPPTSLRRYQDFGTRCLSAMTAVENVLLEVGLEAGKNSDGLNQAFLTFNIVAPLPPEALARLTEYRKILHLLIRKREDAIPQDAKTKPDGDAFDKADDAF
jgi:hypothetical protein